MMKGRSLGFFISLAIVGALMLCTLGQLMGHLWFRQAEQSGDASIMRLKGMLRAVKVQPSHSFYWFSMGREFQNLSTRSGLPLIEGRRRLEQAREYMERSISLEPTSSLYHFHLGWVYAGLSVCQRPMKQEAEKAFSRAILLNPTNREYRWSVANYYLNQYRLFLKREEGAYAKTDIDRARQNFQRHFRAFLELGSSRELKRVLNRCFAVRQQYDDVRGVIRDHPLDHLHLAEFLSQKGMLDAARQEFKIAMSQDPTNPEVYHAYGSALLTGKHHEEALAMWKRAQALNPRDARAYLALSAALWGLGRKDEALVELQQLVRIRPDEVSYHLLLARRFGEAGHPKDALSAYQGALENDPNNDGIYALLAEYWWRQGNLSGVETALQKAISLNPSRIAHQDQLARLYLMQKRYARAIETWQEALKQNPELVAALKGIARSYEGLEAWAMAIRYYRRALALKPGDQSFLQRIEAIKKNHDTGGESG